MTKSNHSETKAAQLLFFAWGVAFLATAGSLYMSEVLHYIPCDLCWIQRIFMYPLALILGIAFFREEYQIIYYALPLAIIGSLFSIYHILVQQFPDTIGSLAACEAGSCIGDYLYWFGFITIPMLALTAFILIIISLLWMKKHASRVSKT
ncbi:MULTISPECIES: disulfide oxidoreductase [unclassified Paenibacillus]|uniref:disulfide oxidoreductase n=1 Tax=unclassified Paenibacillus TaxID=185978 RepID=UPI002F4176A8